MISRAAHSDGFVGRYEELKLLREAFRDACDSGGRFVAVEGEPGIGKSRLIREFAESLTGNATIAFGECAEQIRRPYLPVEHILERLGLKTPKPPRNLAARTPAEERAAYFEAVAETLRRESARRPLVMVVEDVQWADDASIDLLRYLTTALGEGRVLALVTFRTPGPLQNAPLSAFCLSVARARGTALRLHALRRYDIKNLVANLVREHAASLPLQILAKIEALCEGNPLFAEELTRVAIEKGEIALGTSLPLSAQAMLSERLATFSESERAILIRAAIVGKIFDARFVAEIAGTSCETVLATVQRARDHELVVTSRDHPYRFAFRHALIRQVLADRLVLALAAPLHLRIARGIEGDRNSVRRAAELAYHYSEARVADKARYYNELAGQTAWNVYAYRDAIHFYSAALQWEYPPGLARAAIYERLGRLLYIDGVGEEPGDWFERARREYESIGDAIGESQASLMIADQWWVDARTSDGLRAAIRAASSFEGLGEERLRLAAAVTVARYASTLGATEEASGHLSALQRSGTALGGALAAEFYEVRAEVRAALGDVRGALDDGALAAERASETESSELIAQVQNNIALACADLGELVLAIEHHLNALAEARRTGLLWRVAYCALNFAQTLTWQGELHSARSLVLEALDCGVTTATFKTKAAAVGIPLALAMNDRALLRRCADAAALTYAQSSGEQQRIAATGAAVAELQRAQGASAQAFDTLGATIGAMTSGHRAWNLWLQTALWGRRQDVDRAREVLARCTGRPRVLRAYRLLLQARALGEASVPRAQRIAKIAERCFASMGFRWHAALCAELADDRERALAQYVTMGAARDAERLAGAAAAAPHGLTARQAEIAALVARGEFNRTIAAKLHISEHTVEHHLTGIFSRMGVKSRAQLIARWISNDSQ